jgi:putative acetyltransferase
VSEPDKALTAIGDRGVVIRTYSDVDLEAVVSCFGQSVREIGARYYAPEQIAAWAPDSPDMEDWANRLRAGKVFVADVNGVLAGFVRVEDTGFVDLLYVPQTMSAAESVENCWRWLAVGP